MGRYSCRLNSCRRAKRAQWIWDAFTLAHYTIWHPETPEHAARVLRRESAARRARRLARRSK